MRFDLRVLFVLAAGGAVPACGLIAGVEPVDYRALVLDDASTSSDAGGADVAADRGLLDASGSVFCVARRADPTVLFCADFDSDATGEAQFSPIAIATGGRGERVQGSSPPSAFALAAGPGASSTMRRGGIDLPKSSDVPVTFEVAATVAAGAHQFLSVGYADNNDACTVLLFPGRVVVKRGPLVEREQAFTAVPGSFQRYAISLAPQSGTDVDIRVAVAGTSVFDASVRCDDTRRVEMVLGPSGATVEVEDVFDDVVVRQ